MSARRAIWEVARRELVERSRSRVMRISFALLLVVAVGGAVAAARLSGQTPTDKVGLVGARSAAVAPAIRLEASAAGRHVRLRRLANATAAAREVRKGAVALALLDGERILVKTSRSGPAVRVVQNAIAAQALFDRLRSSGLTEAQALRALTPTAVAVDVLEPNSHNTASNRTLVFVSALALYMVLVLFGQAVAQSVTEEKSSRVVELLLTTLSPRRLLAGKVLGVGLLGLGLLLVPGIAALVAGSLAGGAGLPSAAPKAVALVMLWFVLGYFLYSVVFAAVGALVSRQEDLTAAIVPVTLLLAGGFFLVAVVANTNPDGTVGQVAAFLPPFSPMVVPTRMVLGNMGALALAAAIALDLIATAALVVLAGRIYEQAILHTGAPLKLRRALRTASPPEPRERRGQAVIHADTEEARTRDTEPRLKPATDLALRIAALALIFGGLIMGLDQPVAIVILALGWALLILEQGVKRWPHKPAH